MNIFPIIPYIPHIFSIPSVYYDSSIFVPFLDKFVKFYRIINF